MYGYTSHVSTCLGTSNTLKVAPEGEDEWYEKEEEEEVQRRMRAHRARERFLNPALRHERTNPRVRAQAARERFLDPALRHDRGRGGSASAKIAVEGSSASGSDGIMVEDIEDMEVT